MQNPNLKVAAIHDISGFGRCSLTVIIPTLSAMGIQVCPVPTAVLSTHTGGFGDPVFEDLTSYIGFALQHYKDLDLTFDCIYTGFLGSASEIDHCLDFFRSFPNALAVVDPVMGDHGLTYKTYTPELIKRMTELVSVANLITPNLTESAILLGEPYPTYPMTIHDIKSWLVRQGELGPKYVIMTSVEMANGKYINAAYDRDNRIFWKVDCNYIPASYAGTGDIFSSIVVGSLLKGDSLPIAMDLATRFLEFSIKTTYGFGCDHRDGIMIERCLPWLMTTTQPNSYQKI